MSLTYNKLVLFLLVIIVADVGEALKKDK